MDFKNFQKAIQEQNNDDLFKLLKAKADAKTKKLFCKVNTIENVEKMIVSITQEFRNRNIFFSRVKNDEWIKITDIYSGTNRIIRLYDDNLKFYAIGIY